MSVLEIARILGEGTALGLLGFLIRELIRVQEARVKEAEACGVAKQKLAEKALEHAQTLKEFLEARGPRR